MYRQILLAFLLAPLASASDPSPRLSFGGLTRNGALMLRQSGCGSENVCEQACAPVSANCCNDGSSTYCNAGNNCIPGGCCPIGKTCSGGGGTITYYNIPTSIAGGGISIPTSFSLSNTDLSSETADLSSTLADFTSSTDLSSEIPNLSSTLTDVGSLTSTAASSSAPTNAGLTVLSHSSATTAQSTPGLVLSTPTQTASSSQASSTAGNKVATGGVAPRVLDGRSVIGGVIVVAAAILL